jgi:2-polyprenyl-3-methyl-5-hydroxy-6-metoxy-1,4-benzoquinol methylase
MTAPLHRFTTYTLDPVPDALWQRAEPVPGIKLGFCDTCGFYHVDPYPPEDYLRAFYSNYEMPTSQANLAETARLLARTALPDTHVLDVGCGDGSFLLELHKLGFRNLSGFDEGPAVERAMARAIGDIRKSNVWKFLDEAERGGEVDAEAIVMVNVLEHVVEPLALLRRIHHALPPHGLLCITVPNDFSALQRAFLEVKGHLPWFVCLPDHLNYFDFNTLKHALAGTGFDVIDQSALYPLELFLLQDLDYIADPALGPVAHQRRVTFEDNLKAAGMTDVLDHFYRTLAAGGYGRDVMVVATKTGAAPRAQR